VQLGKSSNSGSGDLENSVQSAPPGCSSERRVDRVGRVARQKKAKNTDRKRGKEKNSTSTMRALSDVDREGARGTFSGEGTRTRMRSPSRGDRAQGETGEEDFRKPESGGRVEAWRDVLLSREGVPRTENKGRHRDSSFDRNLGGAGTTTGGRSAD